MKHSQMPKNIYHKLAINISFIIIWLLSSYIIWYCIWQGLLSIYPTYKFLTEIWIASFIFPPSIAFQLMFIIPTILISRYIWVKKK